MKKIATLLVIVGMLAAGLPRAFATAQLRLSDGTPSGTVVITDQGPGDMNASPGLVAFFGALGTTGWTGNFTFGISKPAFGSPLSPFMDINTNSTGTGVLTIEFTDTDFLLPGTATANFGGNTAGTATYRAWTDPNNIAFGKTTLLASIGPMAGGAFNGTGSGPVGVGPYSLTLETVISHAIPNSRTGFDADLTITGTVPPPPEIEISPLEDVTVCSLPDDVEFAFTATASGDFPAPITSVSAELDGNPITPLTVSGLGTTSVVVTGVAHVTTGGLHTIVAHASNVFATSTASTTFSTTVQLNKIIGHVFYDTNGNGVEDGSETGTSGVTVNLYNSANVLVGTQTSDGSGNYLFDNLVIDTYTVVAMVPVGFSATTPVQSTVVIVACTNAAPKVGIRQLLPPTVIISDLSSFTVCSVPATVSFTYTAVSGGVSPTPITSVSAKLDGNPISGLTISGLGTTSVIVSGSVVVTTAGSHTIVGSATNAGGTSTDSTTFSISLQSKNITGVVYFDVNHDGDQDVGDYGLSGVTVKLYNSSNQLVGTTTTDSAGGYLFSNVPVGTYSVVANAPAGLVCSDEDSGYNYSSCYNYYNKYKCYRTTYRPRYNSSCSQGTDDCTHGDGCSHGTGCKYGSSCSHSCGTYKCTRGSDCSHGYNCYKGSGCQYGNNCSHRLNGKDDSYGSNCSHGSYCSRGSTCSHGTSSSDCCKRMVTVDDCVNVAAPIGFSLDFTECRTFKACGYTSSSWCYDMDKCCTGSYSSTCKVSSSKCTTYSSNICGRSSSYFYQKGKSECRDILKSTSTNCKDMLKKQLLAAYYNYEHGCYMNGSKTLTGHFLYWGESIMKNSSQFTTTEILWAKDWFNAYNNANGGCVAGPAP